MTILNGRFLELQVDTIKIVHRPPSVGLRVEFDVVRTLKKEPNAAEIKIYGLSPDHRAALSKVDLPVVSLTAGYETEHTTLFYGQCHHARHEHAGSEVVTTLSTSDGGKAYQTARLHKSFGPRTKAGEVLRALAKAIPGVKPGNLETAIQRLNAGKAADIYIDGCVIAGHVPPCIDLLCRSAGLEWSIQENKLQFLDVGKALSSTAIVLTESNLTVTPAISGKNTIEAQTFIQQDFLPGRQVQVRHEFAAGVFRLEKCHYTGDTHADNWFVDFEAKGILK